MRLCCSRDVLQIRCCAAWPSGILTIAPALGCHALRGSELLCSVSALLALPACAAAPFCATKQRFVRHQRVRLMAVSDSVAPRVALRVIEVEPAPAKPRPTRAVRMRTVLAAAFADRFRRRPKVDDVSEHDDDKSLQLRQEIRKHVAQRRMDTMKRESSVKCSCW